jgi:hypothetical protein
LDDAVEGTFTLAEVIEKDLVTLFAEDFLFLEACEPLDRLIEGGDPPLSIYGEDAYTQLFQEPAELFVEVTLIGYWQGS